MTSKHETNTCSSGHFSPEGYHTITPSLTIKDADKAIEFYKRAFGAEERERHLGSDGKSIMYAEIKIGDSIIMVNDEFPDMRCKRPETLGGTPVSLYVYVENVDSVVDCAVKAGAKITVPVADMFWGDRFGQVIDPFGHRWSIATYKKDVSPEELKKAKEAWKKEKMSCAQK